MSATAQTKQRPAWTLKPAWEITKRRIRRMATEQRHDADALALHYFNTELDNLLEWQATEIETELGIVEREQFLAIEQASGELGYCFECGIQVSETSAQCGGCKEGIVPQSSYRYDHSLAQQLAHLGRTTKRSKFIDYN